MSENFHFQKSSGPASSGWRVAVLGRNPRRTLTRASVLLLGSFVVFKFLFLPIRVTGISMDPNYRDGRINFVNSLSYAWSEPRRGDVVAIQMAGRRVLLLKRVIGLPGETVAITRGVVTINGQILPEPYVKFSSGWDKDAVTLGPGEYFVVGDNRSMDVQHHTLGVTLRQRIVGKVLL